MHLRNVRIVVFEDDAGDLADPTMRDIISNLDPA